jgi:hypothetical protein
MDSVTAMAVLIGILAVVLVGGFIAVWMRDKGRSNEVADDAGRLDTDPSKKGRNSGH